MARTGDPHPEPDDPNEGPAPKFPPGAEPHDIDPLPRPAQPDLTPGTDLPPAREPFPDHLPDPGLGKP